MVIAILGGTGDLGSALARRWSGIGGALMDESITRAAGATHGQEMIPARTEQIFLNANRHPRQRTTVYATAPPERCRASFIPIKLTTGGLPA